MDENELNQKLAYINEFKDNIIRSINIRVKISQDRIEAIRLLEQNHKDPNGIGLLRRFIQLKNKVHPSNTIFSAGNI